MRGPAVLEVAQNGTKIAKVTRLARRKPEDAKRWQQTIILESRYLLTLRADPGSALTI